MSRARYKLTPARPQHKEHKEYMESVILKQMASILAIVLLCGNLAAAKTVKTGYKVSGAISDAQLEFINEHFDYVITHFLAQEIREAFQGPQLLLYRSIQGTWEGFDQFDWAHIDSCENMFCHSDSVCQCDSTRILTIWDSWLMNGNDLVDPQAPDAPNHWVNYYAVTASDQVYSFDYDGLFIDSAGHKLSRSAVNGIMPWDYSDESWRDGRYAALEFIKSYLPDKMIIFNGLHSDNGAEHSLTLTDGGMWEVFAYVYPEGEYFGQERWLDVIELFQRNNQTSYLSLVSKKPDLTLDIQARMFVVSSYLLICTENVVLSLLDLSHEDTPLYYPEYEIDLGEGTGDYSVLENGLYKREFEKGVVLVNPDETETRSYMLDEEYDKIIPTGGGPIDSNGVCQGSLTYESVTGELELQPVSGVVLKRVSTDVLDEDVPAPKVPEVFFLYQNYPNPFNSTTTIQYHLPESGRVIVTVYNVRGQRVATLVDGVQPAGCHQVEWDASGLGSGIYFYTMRAGGYSLKRMCLLIK